MHFVHVFGSRNARSCEIGRKIMPVVQALLGLSAPHQKSMPILQAWFEHKSIHTV